MDKYRFLPGCGIVVAAGGGDVRTFSVQDRRDAVVRRHHLRGDADGPDEVVASLIALHATDPATVYLSVLARSARSTLADVAAALYDRKTLVRWMAMRRTLFVFPTADVPMIQAAVSTPLGAQLRRQLLSRVRRNGTEPAVEENIEVWLHVLVSAVERSLRVLGTATGARLAAEVPALRTLILHGAPWERPQNLTSPLLTVMGAEGRIVRGVPTGLWTSRHHSWEPVEQWWPTGLPELGRAASQRTLAFRWLERFGPATINDLQWWTGWNKTTVRQALSTLRLEQVDLHGEPGIALQDQVDTADMPAQAPAATLLPSLDPTSMGWKHRAWLLGINPDLVFDSAGNIGPTVWWNGEIIGSWAVAGTGEIRAVLAADRGAAATEAVDTAAALLNRRLDGALITPAIRTPLERSLQ